MMRAVLALWLVVGCSTSKTPKPEITSPKTSKQTTSSSWHGLPSAPGLPDKLSRLTFGMDRALIVGDLTALLDGAGFALSPKSSAKAKLSADGRLRYLTVTVQASSQALTAAWPKSRVAQIDNRHSAVVWYLPKRGVQIQMRAYADRFDLVYLPVTSLDVLVGIPNDSGNTFASLVGKSLNVSQQLFHRMEKSLDGHSMLAWAAPVADTTVSLNAQLRLEPTKNEVSGITLFLKDSEDNRLKSKLVETVKNTWQRGANEEVYHHQGIELRFGQTPRLSPRKRVQYPFVLHLTKQAPVIKN